MFRRIGCLNVWNVVAMMLAESVEGGKRWVFMKFTRESVSRSSFSGTSAKMMLPSDRRGTRNLIRELSLMMELGIKVMD